MSRTERLIRSSNQLLRIVHCHYTLWRCPTCRKLRRTLGRARQYYPPLCLHQYTPFELRVGRWMDVEPEFER